MAVSCAFRTGNDCTLLSGTCKPIGICWSGRENSWRGRRESRWRGRRSAPLYLRASGTFSWTWGTWWAKSAVRYPQSSYWNPQHILSLFLAHAKTLEEVTPTSDNKLFCFLLQMSYMRSSWVKPISPTAWAPSNPEASSKTAWDRQVEGYIILRDLDLYLTKLARDFLLLASKTRVTQHWKKSAGPLTTRTCTQTGERRNT